MPRALFAVVLAISTVPTLGAEPSATYAAPEIVIVHGDLLPQRVVISDFEQNAKWFSALSQFAPSNVPLAGRPFLEIAMFWGPDWNAFVRRGESTASLDSENADQWARCYLAVGHHPALFIFNERGMFGASAKRTGLFRYVEASGLDTLKKHGVPISR